VLGWRKGACGQDHDGSPTRVQVRFFASIVDAYGFALKHAPPRTAMLTYRAGWTSGPPRTPHRVTGGKLRRVREGAVRMVRRTSRPGNDVGMSKDLGCCRNWWLRCWPRTEMPGLSAAHPGSPQQHAGRDEPKPTKDESEANARLDCGCTRDRAGLTALMRRDAVRLGVPPAKWTGRCRWRATRMSWRKHFAPIRSRGPRAPRRAERASMRAAEKSRFQRKVAAFPPPIWATTQRADRARIPLRV